MEAEEEDAVAGNTETVAERHDPAQSGEAAGGDRTRAGQEEDEEDLHSTTSTPPLEEQERRLSQQEGDGQGEDRQREGAQETVEVFEVSGDEAANEVGGNNAGAAAAPSASPRLSPVSLNGSLGPPDDGGGDVNLGEAAEMFSSLSEDEVTGDAPKASNRNLEDGEIEGGGGRGGGAGGGWGRGERSPSPPHHQPRRREKGRKRSGGSESREAAGRAPQQQHRSELPRYDVRNIINSRKGARIRDRDDERDRRGRRSRHRSTRSRSRSRSRSWSRPRSRRRVSWSRSRSRSPARKKKKKGKKNKDDAAAGASAKATSRSPVRDKATKKKSQKANKANAGSETSASTKKRKSSKSPAPAAVTKAKKAKKKKDKTKKKNKAGDKSSSAAADATSAASRMVVTDAINSATGGGTAKAVYASGDKILVSVNFKRSKKDKQQQQDVSSRLDDSGSGPAAKDKPVACVIDLEMSPYGVYEPSPKHDVVDLFTDDEDGGGQSKRGGAGGNDVDIQVLETTAPLTPPGLPPPLDSNAAAVDVAAGAGDSQVMTTHHRGPCTPPLGTEQQTFDFSKGPETPSPPASPGGAGGRAAAGGEPSAGGNSGPAASGGGMADVPSPSPLGDDGDDYDPCDPTAESPTADEITQGVTGTSINGRTDASANETNASSSSSIGAVAAMWEDALSKVKAAPVSSAPSAEKDASSRQLNNSNSTQSAGGALSIFDQVNNGLLLNGVKDKMSNGPSTSSGGLISFNINAAALASAAAVFKDNGASSSSVGAPAANSGVNSTSAAANHSTSSGGGGDYSLGLGDMDCSPTSPQGSDLSDLFEPPKSTEKAKKSSHKGKGKHSSGSKLKSSAKTSRSVQMKLIDDKLRIIDDVPTSAVEMAVKEKFLRKVQRQERIVDEIKMVLKPFYNRKKISKDSYKEIMRKCVPKVCHSKNGEINTNKIQKMVHVYVKKYKHREKKKGVG